MSWWLISLSLSLSLSLLPLLLFPSLPHEDWFVLCLVVLFPANLYLTLAPSSWWWKWFLDYSKLRLNSDIYFKIGLVLLALNHCVLAYFLEVCRQGLTKPHRSLMSPWKVALHVQIKLYSLTRWIGTIKWDKQVTCLVATAVWYRITIRTCVYMGKKCGSCEGKLTNQFPTKFSSHAVAVNVLHII